jgi:uncharacterized membrane protein
MTPQQRQQLESLLQEQERLARAVNGFDERLRDFMEGVEKTVEPEAPAVAEEWPAEDEAGEPEQLAARIDEALAGETSTPPEQMHLPPPLPVRAPVEHAAARADTPPLGPPDERGYRAPLAESHPGVEEPRGEVPPPIPPTVPVKEPQSLEMTLGTVWLARIGIVILVTGVVFLGNYAYQHIVHRMGHGVKVMLLYLVAAGLGGLGAWLQKRLNTEGRFPQVLMAGGAATAYYTTYAAHFVQRLQVIKSPIAGGILLLFVGAVFVWWADRRKLQTAALIGILLSYYTALINPIGSFTVYSSAILAAAAGLLLVRNGWAMVSWASLVGTYASYSYWLIVRGWPLIFGMGGSGITDPIEDIRRDHYDSAGNLGMLVTYWVLFTATGFLASPAAMGSRPRTTFLTLNNALFFALASWFMAMRHPHEYWAFALCFGVILLALAALARLRRSDDFALDGGYLTQGIAAVTAGLAMKLTGPSLAITLAVESAVLLTAVTRRHGAIYRIGAVTTAVWAFCLTIDRINAAPELIMPLGSTVAALLIFDAWWLKQRSGWLPAMRWSWRAAAFAALGMFLIGDLIMLKVAEPWEPPWLALGAVLATASIYVLRLPEVVLLGQLFLAAAVGLWLSHYPAHPNPNPWTPWWQPLPIIFASLGLAHWWQRQRIMRLVRADALHLAAAIAFVVIGYYWSRIWLVEQSFAVVLACAGVATMVYGYCTRAWAISLVGQVFAAAAVFEVLHHFGRGHFPWFIALLPIAGIIVAAAVFARGDAQRWPEELRPGLKPAVAFYWLLTFLLIVAWVFEYIPSRWQILFFAGLGALLFLSGARWPGRARTYTGLAFSAIAFLDFWGRLGAPGWPDLLALLLLPASHRLATRLSPEAKLPAPWPDVVVGLTTASVWLWVTRWMHANYYGEMLTVAWSVLAVVVFVAGLALRERVYRIGGFIILALAVGRIYLVDVWKVEAVYRILSFMVLGIVLLALGFVYNRYADKIRKWL